MVCFRGCSWLVVVICWWSGRWVRCRSKREREGGTLRRVECTHVLSESLFRLGYLEEAFQMERLALATTGEGMAFGIVDGGMLICSIGLGITGVGDCCGC